MDRRFEGGGGKAKGKAPRAQKRKGQTYWVQEGKEKRAANRVGDKHWRSTLNTILHKRAGWTLAAKAIMQYGLPRLEQPAQPEDATEQIKRLGEFARDMAQWLINFTQGMHAYRQTEGYDNNYQALMVALQRKRRSHLMTDE